MELLKPKLTSQKCQGFLFSTTPAFYESIFHLFHWGILSLSPVDDSACDFVVNLMGIFARYLLFFPKGSIFCFLVLKIISLVILWIISSVKKFVALVRPLNQGITISWRALSSSLMWTLLLRMHPTSEKINTLLDIHK
jgi:hypothetical protein